MKTRISVPPIFGSWYRNYRLVNCDLTQNDIFRNSTLGKRTLIDVEAGILPSHTEDTIKALANAIGMTIGELIEEIEGLWEEYESPMGNMDDFKSLLKAFTEIDDYIRYLILSIDRETRKTKPDLISKSYRDILYAQVSQRFPELHDPLPDFSTFLTKPETLRVLLDSLPQPDVILDIENGFNKIEYAIDEGSLVLKNPELLWDCNCLSSGDKIPKCRIHTQKLGKKVSDCFDENVKIVYRGFDFHWQDINALWPPSVDSFYLINNIIHNTDLLDNRNNTISSIIDIGTGTGFLGIMLFNLIKGAQKLCLTDWSTTSYLYSSINWFINASKHQRNLDSSFEFRVATNSYWDYFDTNQRKDNFDLVICNPPYLPIPGHFRELQIAQTTAGTDLLEHVIHRSKNLGKKVIIQFSHLAQERAEKAADESGVSLQPFGKPRLVPFRIPSPIKNSDYMRWLLDEKAEGKEKPWALVRNNHDQSNNMKHQYYHYIQSYFVES